MQILQWLFKVTQEEEAKETASTVQKKPVCKDLVLHKKSGSYRRSKRSEIIEVEWEDYSRTCFYSTLNLKILGSFHKNKGWLQEVIIKEEKLMGHKGDVAVAHVGNKVLPISDAITKPATANDRQCDQSSEKRDKPKGNKAKAISRMKELLRWASATKAEKGGNYISRKVLYFRTRGALKAAAHDDDSSLSSPKISFRWDVGSCSTNSSAYSGFSFTSSSTKTDRTQIKPVIHSAVSDVSDLDLSIKDAIASTQESENCTSRRGGNWITTDDEFVVLEL